MTLASNKQNVGSGGTYSNQLQQSPEPQQAEQPRNSESVRGVVLFANDHHGNVGVGNAEAADSVQQYVRRWSNQRSKFQSCWLTAHLVVKSIKNQDLMYCFAATFGSKLSSPEGSMTPVPVHVCVMGGEEEAPRQLLRGGDCEWLACVRKFTRTSMRKTMSITRFHTSPADHAVCRVVTVCEWITLCVA